MGSGCGDFGLFPTDLVTGAKYVSCLSEVSEGVGDGEMTRGVAGIGY
jgi:hypothetical protein